MKAKDVIKQAMKIRGYSNDLLAKKLGYAHASGVSQRLRAEQDMRMDLFVKFMEELNCDVIVQSRTKDGLAWNLTQDISPVL